MKEESEMKDLVKYLDLSKKLDKKKEELAKVDKELEILLLIKKVIESHVN